MTALACALLLAAEVNVYAASSLREAFTQIAKDFEAGHPGDRVVLQFAGSQELRVQIENGAPADVFASADERQLALLPGVRGAVFAHNEPVVVVPRDNPAGLRSFSDLPRARRVVLGASEVPIGAYADRILARAGLKLQNVVSRELNVRQVLAKVALGEADAAIVYRTDALATPGVRALEIPPGVNVEAEYPIAALPRAKEPRLAAAFVAAVLSPRGRAVLEKHGFSP